jgi:hypothetical protein
MCMRDKISCASCKREIDDDDTCVSREEDGTNYVFDSYICARNLSKAKSCEAQCVHSRGNTMVIG